MSAALRVFQDLPAAREATPLLVGLVGPSGSGKTYSALRLATGIQKVSGGDIYGIDTEARRMLHYADKFRFRHMEFKAPFGSLDYLAAIEHCGKRGAKIIIVDSASHEHEGPGGVLEQHVAEQERLAKAWNSTMEKVTMAAWQKPKADRRRLLNSILQMPINFIFCFRAKDKIKPDRAGKPQPLGWMPIAGEEFVYEMTVNMLLYPASGGVPSWQPAEAGERAMVKLPSQFTEIFSKHGALSEEIGEQLAEWAAGSKKPPAKADLPLDAPPPAKPHGNSPGKMSYPLLQKFAEAKRYIGDELYYRCLGNHGVEKSNQFADEAAAKRCLAEMRQLAEAAKLKRQQEQQKASIRESTHDLNVDAEP